MKPFLLDVNLLIALAWPNHIHHEVARKWFHKKSNYGWATCPLTQCGFVRISSNSAIMGNHAASPQEAVQLLKRITALKYHRFWKDEIELTDFSSVPDKLLVGHRQVTDAYLLGLAMYKKGKLATLDQRIGYLLTEECHFKNVLEVVAVN